MIWPDTVLDRLDATRCGRGWKAPCPIHDDRTPSLQIYLGRNGALMLGCFTGCNKAAILAAKGLTMKDLFPPENRTRDEPFVPPRAVAVYPYTDEEGRILYEKVRYVPKTFRVRQPDEQGGYRWDLEGVRRVPFQLCEMLAFPTAPVLLVEGEKDVLTAESLGLLATCTTEPAGWWESDSPYPPFFTGRRVVVIPDEDKAGLNCARKVVGALMLGGVGGVRVARLPGLPEHGDLSSWVELGGTREELIGIIRATKEWKSN